MSTGERNPFDILDDGFHLLREAPVSAWAFYFAGAVPFLLAVLWALTETGILYTTRKGLEDSFACALAFFWMQFCRVRFAGKLEEQLRPGMAEPWSAARVIRCLLAQSGLQSTRLVALPLAALLTLPWAWTVSLYQNLTTLSSRPAMPASELFRKARKLSSSGQKQIWILLTLLSLLGLIVFLNAGILVLILPSMFKALTGFENEWTRGTGNPLTWRLFQLAAGITWVLMGPLTQAVFVQQVYLTEGVIDGADLLAALRRPFTIAAVLVCFAGVIRSEVPPPVLQRNIEQVLQERQYSWHARDEQQTSGGQNSFLKAIGDAIHKVGLAIQAIGEWLRQVFEQKPGETDTSKATPPTQSLRWLIGALIGGLGFALVMFFIRSRPAKPPALTKIPSPSVDLEDEGVRAADLPEEGWLEKARECADRQEYRLALRALYLATLAHLGRRNLLVLGDAKTNRDYMRELRRRAANERLHELFRENVRTFEASWYGRHETGAGTFAAFQQNWEALRADAQ